MLINRFFVLLSFIACLLLLTGCNKSTKAINPTAKTKQQTNHNTHDFAAHWLTPKLILLPSYNEKHQYFLNETDGNNSNVIQLINTDISQQLKNKFPHLAKFFAFKVNLSPIKAKKWLKNQLSVTEKDQQGKLLKSSYVQTANVIDALYTQNDHDADETSDLGATITAQNITFKLWAPTAQHLKVLLFKNDSKGKKVAATPAFINMIEDSNTGIWQAKLANSNHQLDNIYYQYQLTLYHPATQKIERLTTTDPYSLSLSVNSEYSQVVNLNDVNTQPQGWQQQARPTLKHVEDNILYEVHIRDFSASDPTLNNSKHRGKYGAFNEQNSAGIKHLKALKNAGLTTIHLLPVFDIGTVNEDATKSIDLQDNLAKVCRIAAKTSICSSNYNPKQSLISLLNDYKNTETTQQKIQQLISEIRAFDNYNWGYDPYHYTVPEGSYAQNPEGIARLKAFRQMVQSIHNLGFRVVMDVVYNHTHHAGLAKTSVLDKIVPNYYQRLHPITGEIEQSTCCDNTATERVMMAKLMTDSLVTWARDYAIDGFRFDLMGHQPKAAMLKAREAVRKVDADTYFYGEGWNFGEVANNQRFVQASQLELAGSEIGTYSDRLRDAVRGAGFNKSGDEIRKTQGLGNGLATIPNELNNELVDRSINQASYTLLADQTRIGLAGNLTNFPLKEKNGKTILGKDIPYGDQPTGYALDPADTINYVSKHDNQTLWDNNQYRNAFNLTSDQRVRMHLQSLAFTLYSQGIPFMQMGTELLRSKSFLRDSYDYGDWFNAVDFTMHTNNYNVGLPPAEKDQENWALIKNVLKQNQGRDLVTPAQIKFSSDIFNEMLKIRTSSSLFRLTSEQAIIKQLHFLNNSEKLKAAQQGLIVMKLDAANTAKSEEQFQSIIVIFNTNNHAETFAYTPASEYQLHPVQQTGVDEVIKQSQIDKNSFTVPALTTAVFTKK
jgi:pullulanase-type alpha-1,6-glucosidase